MFFSNNVIDKQRIASDPNISVYVSASAGSGKTKVLTDRILRLLLLGVKIDNIICLTFTNAAAAEMLDRLQKRLEYWFSANDTQLVDDITNLTGTSPNNEELKLAKVLLGYFIHNIDKVKIQTLHSFCIRILQYSQIILDLDKGADLGSKLLDGFTKQELIKNALNDVLQNSENLEEEISKSIKNLAIIYDYGTLVNLLTNTLSRQDKLMRYLNQYVIKGKNTSKYIQYDYNSLHVDIYKRLGAEYKVTEDNLIYNYLTTIDNGIYQELSFLLIEYDEELSQLFLNWSQYDMEWRFQHFSKYLNIFLTNEYTARVRLPIKASFLKIYPQFKEFIVNEQSRLVSLSQAIHTQKCASFTSSFHVLVAAIQQRYLYSKSISSYFDYDDIIMHTINLLENPNTSDVVLYHMDFKIDHILLDEAQDISPSQWHLINLLMSEFYSGLGARDINRTLFVVGDFKQSIYGFQGANPDLFQQVNKFYQEKFEQVNKIWRNIELDTSFRCNSTILNLVNNICAQPSVLNAFGLDESNAKIKHLAWNNKAGIIELWKITLPEQFIEKSIKTKYNEVNWNINSQQNELKYHDNDDYLAEQIAERIEQLIKNGNKANDILVLFRKRCLLQEYLVMCLKSKSIPVHDFTFSGNDRHIIINDLIALGKFVLLPDDDLNLAILLKSPIIGMNEEELFTLAYQRSGSLWNELEYGDFEYCEYLRNFLSLYKESTSISSFYRSVLYHDNYYIIKAYNKCFGRYAEAIIDCFLGVIDEFEEKNINGLLGFIEWFDQGVSNFKINSRNIDSVKVMTVHGAKGLESEIVILADASLSDNLPNDRIIWCEDWFVVSTIKDFTNSVVEKIKAQNNYKLDQENLRLLYVALTRAKSHLYVVGIENTSNSLVDDDNWFNIIAKSLHIDNRL